MDEPTTEECCRRYPGLTVHRSSEPMIWANLYQEPYLSTATHDVFVLSREEYPQPDGERCPQFRRDGLTGVNPGRVAPDTKYTTFLVALAVRPNSRLYNFLQRRRRKLLRGKPHQYRGEHYYHLTLFQCQIGVGLIDRLTEEFLKEIIAAVEQMFTGDDPLRLRDAGPKYQMMGPNFYGRTFEVQNGLRYREFINRVLDLFEDMIGRMTQGYKPKITEGETDRGTVRTYTYRAATTSRDHAKYQVKIKPYYYRGAELSPHISILRKNEVPEGFWSRLSSPDTAPDIEGAANWNPRLELIRGDYIDLSDGFRLEMKLSEFVTGDGHRNLWSAPPPLPPASQVPLFVGVFFDQGVLKRLVPDLPWDKPPYHMTLIYIGGEPVDKGDRRYKIQKKVYEDHKMVYNEQYAGLMKKRVWVHLEEIVPSEDGRITVVTAMATRFLPRHPFDKKLHITADTKQDVYPVIGGQMLETGRPARGVSSKIMHDGVEGVWIEGRVDAVFPRAR